VEAVSEQDSPVGEQPSVTTPSLDDSGRTSFHLAPAPWIAGASDIGRRHHTNQDFLALAVPDPATVRAAMVISDGVSSSTNAELASFRAATSVRDDLARILVSSVNLDEASAAELMERVYRKANGVVLADGLDGTPVGSCTLITALVIGDDAFIANLGDTRAYWFADDGTQQQLSIDDSIAQAQIELGMDREAAESGIHAHAITKWLGPSATDIVPRTSHFAVDRPGWLVVCSDGLWNYASRAEDLGSIVRQIWASMPPGDGPDVLAQTLVGWANSQGGRDNISVALIRMGTTKQPPVVPAPADGSESAITGDSPTAQPTLPESDEPTG
jgi:PPM family protein phosphatase